MTSQTLSKLFIIAALFAASNIVKNSIGIYKGFMLLHLMSKYNKEAYLFKMYLISIYSPTSASVRLCFCV